MKKIYSVVIIISMLLVMLGTTACNNLDIEIKKEIMKHDLSREEKEDTKEQEEETSQIEEININDDGSFVVKVNTDRQIVSDKEFTRNDGKIKQIEWYTDVYCPDCERAHNGTKEFIHEAVRAGEMEIKYHPLNFLPDKTNNNFSLVTASWIVGTADKAPNKLFDLMDEFYKEEFREKFKEERNLEEELVNFISEKEILSKEEVDAILSRMNMYVQYVEAGSFGIRDNPYLKEISPLKEKRVFVPYIFDIKERKVLNGEETDTDTYILKPLQGLTNCTDECEE